MAGSDDPSCISGGHVVLRKGFREVRVDGVESKQLGQGGRIGHALQSRKLQDPLCGDARASVPADFCAGP